MYALWPNGIPLWSSLPEKPLPDVLSPVAAVSAIASHITLRCIVPIVGESLDPGVVFDVHAAPCT